MPSKAQLRKIWAAAREIGLEEDELRDLVEEVSGSRSISGLTFTKAGQVIDHLVQAGARAGAGTSKPSGRRTGKGEVLLITGEQRDLIDALRARLGGNWQRERYFEGACMRLLKKPRPRTAGDGARVIEMLKRRIEHAEAHAG